MRCYSLTAFRPFCHQWMPCGLVVSRIHTGFASLLSQPGRGAISVGKPNFRPLATEPLSHGLWSSSERNLHFFAAMVIAAP